MLMPVIAAAFNNDTWLQHEPHVPSSYAVLLNEPYMVPFVGEYMSEPFDDVVLDTTWFMMKTLHNVCVVRSVLHSHDECIALVPFRQRLVVTGSKTDACTPWSNMSGVFVANIKANDIIVEAYFSNDTRLILHARATTSDMVEHTDLSLPSTTPTIIETSFVTDEKVRVVVKNVHVVKKLIHVSSRMFFALSIFWVSLLLLCVVSHAIHERHAVPRTTNDIQA